MGNCGTTYGGLTGKTKEDFGHGNAKFVPYTNVFDNPLTDTKRLEAVEIDSSQNQVAYGDVFFTVSSETPDEVGMSSVWLSNQEDVYLNSFCFGYRQDSTFDPHYLAYMLRSSSVRSNLTLLAQGISRFNISKNKVMELSVPVPSAVEQKQLGQYFTKLDDLITLHQRKRQYRCLYGYLSWEQRKLGELIQLGGSGGTPSANNPDYYGGDIPFLSIADISGRDITNTAKTLTDEGLQNSAAWIVPSGAVSLAMYASVGKVGIIRQDTATSQAFYNMVFDNEALRDFVFTRLEKAETDSEWEPYISTGTQRNLNADKVKSFSLDVPSNEEVSEISAYFANLDTLITLHQRQSNGKAHNIIILSRTKNRQLDIAKSAVLGLETRGNSRKLLNEHPIQQRFLDIP